MASHGHEDALDERESRPISLRSASEKLRLIYPPHSVDDMEEPEDDEDEASEEEKESADEKADEVVEPVSKPVDPADQ